MKIKTILRVMKSSVFLLVAFLIILVSYSFPAFAQQECSKWFNNEANPDFTVCVSRVKDSDHIHYTARRAGSDQAQAVTVSLPGVIDSLVVLKNHQRALESLNQYLEAERRFKAPPTGIRIDGSDAPMPPKAIQSSVEKKRNKTDDFCERIFPGLQSEIKYGRKITFFQLCLSEVVSDQARIAVFGFEAGAAIDFHVSPFFNVRVKNVNQAKVVIREYQNARNCILDPKKCSRP